MSTEEQETVSREACAQAEDTIVADSDELGSVDGRTDRDEEDGYASDGFSSASTSIISSVRDYMYENGRRYHRYREGKYNFPNDEVEQSREDMKHAMTRLLCGQKLHFAPIGDCPQEILDLGTGTGIWAIEMGEEYPCANVLGLDLSPIQPDWVPPNVRFQVDDVESTWLHPPNHFDFVHSRHTVMAFKDWPGLLQRSLTHLKPGGWIELQEILHEPLSMGEEDEKLANHPVSTYWAHIRAGLAARDVDLHAVKGGRLTEMMHDAGFARVRERVFHVPIGTWPKNKVLKMVGVYWRTILLDGIQAIALGPLTRGLKWSREQVEVFLVDVRRGYLDNSALMFMPLHIIYGQKPRTQRPQATDGRSSLDP